MCLLTLFFYFCLDVSCFMKQMNSWKNCRNSFAELHLFLWLRFIIFWEAYLHSKLILIWPAPNIVALNINLAAPLPLQVLESRDSVRKGMDLCLKWDHLFFNGRGPGHVPRAPGSPIVPVTLMFPSSTAQSWRRGALWRGPEWTPLALLQVTQGQPQKQMNWAWLSPSF